MNKVGPIDPLSVRLQHRIYEAVFREMCLQITLAESLGGGIVPLLGPTRCGKSELLEHLRDHLGETKLGPHSLIPTPTFALGSVPPKPNDRDLYRSVLIALGHDCGPKERTSLVRERLIAILREEGTKIVALDESSHCAEPGANLSPRAAADHFKAIVDATGITLILAGLPKFQKLIDENEQFRERSLQTVLFPPYAWSRQEDREGFTEAVLGILAHISDQGAEIDFDDLEMTRRLYGASGGRVALTVRILAAALKIAPAGSLTFDAVAKGAEASLQAALRPGTFFQADAPSENQLVHAYAAVMKDADLPVAISTVDEFEAVRFGRGR